MASSQRAFTRFTNANMVPERGANPPRERDNSSRNRNSSGNQFRLQQQAPNFGRTADHRDHGDTHIRLVDREQTDFPQHSFSTPWGHWSDQGCPRWNDQAWPTRALSFMTQNDYQQTQNPYPDTQNQFIFNNSDFPHVQGQSQNFSQTAQISTSPTRSFRDVLINSNVTLPNVSTQSIANHDTRNFYHIPQVPAFIPPLPPSPPPVLPTQRINYNDNLNTPANFPAQFSHQLPVSQSSSTIDDRPVPPMSAQQLERDKLLTRELEQLDNALRLYSSFDIAKHFSEQLTKTNFETFLKFDKKFVRRLQFHKLDHIIRTDFIRYELYTQLPDQRDRLYRGHPELYQKEMFKFEAKRTVESKQIELVKMILHYIYVDHRAVNLLATLPEDSEPCQIYSQIQNLYNKVTLSRKSSAIAEFHKIERHADEPLLDFILRLESRATFLLEAYDEEIPHSVLIGKLKQALSGELLHIYVNTCAQHGATWESIRQAMFDNIELDKFEKSKSFAGSVSSPRYSHDRSRHSSRSNPGKQFRSRSVENRDFKSRSHTGDRFVNSRRGQSSFPSRPPPGADSSRSAGRGRSSPASPASPAPQASFGKRRYQEFRSSRSRAPSDKSRRNDRSHSRYTPRKKQHVSHSSHVNTHIRRGHSANLSVYENDVNDGDSDISMNESHVAQSSYESDVDAHVSNDGNESWYSDDNVIDENDDVDDARSEYNDSDKNDDKVIESAHTATHHRNKHVKLNVPLSESSVEHANVAVRHPHYDTAASVSSARSALNSVVPSIGSSTPLSIHNSLSLIDYADVSDSTVVGTVHMVTNHDSNTDASIAHPRLKPTDIEYIRIKNEIDVPIDTGVPYTVYGFYGEWLELKMIRSTYVTGNEHSQCMVQHSEHLHRDSLNIPIRFFEGNYCPDTLLSIEYCNCNRCTRMKMRHDDGEIEFMRVFRLPLGSPFFRPERLQRRLEVHYDRIAPKIREMISLRRGEFQNKLQLSDTLEQIGTHTRIGSRVLGPSNPMVIGIECNNKEYRYRIDKPRILHGEHPNADVIVWSDVDRDTKLRFQKCLGNLDSRVSRQLLVELRTICPVSYKMLDRCNCLLCEELNDIRPPGSFVSGVHLTRIHRAKLILPDESDDSGDDSNESDNDKDDDNDDTHDHNMSDSDNDSDSDEDDSQDNNDDFLNDTNAGNDSSTNSNNVNDSLDRTDDDIFDDSIHDDVCNNTTPNSCIHTDSTTHRTHVCSPYSLHQGLCNPTVHVQVDYDVSTLRHDVSRIQTEVVDYVDETVGIDFDNIVDQHSDADVSYDSLSDDSEPPPLMDSDSVQDIMSQVSSTDSDLNDGEPMYVDMWGSTVTLNHVDNDDNSVTSESDWDNESLPDLVSVDSVLLSNNWMSGALAVLERDRHSVYDVVRNLRGVPNVLPLDDLSTLSLPRQYELPSREPHMSHVWIRNVHSGHIYKARRNMMYNVRHGMYRSTNTHRLRTSPNYVHPVNNVMLQPHGHVRYDDVHRMNVIFYVGSVCAISGRSDVECPCTLCKVLWNSMSGCATVTFLDHPGQTMVYVKGEIVTDSVVGTWLALNTLDHALVLSTIIDINNRNDPFDINAVAAAVEIGTLIISDSGASRHMFRNVEVFCNYKHVTGMSVRMAEGAVEPVLGIGNVGPLVDVLHVAKLVYNLVSEPALARQGMSGNWKGLFKSVHDVSGGLFYRATLSDKNLYEINPMYFGLDNPNYNYECYDALATKAEATDLLHRTYGHIDLDRLEVMIRDGYIQWNHDSTPIRLKKCTAPCVVCALGKSKRRSFSNPFRRVTVPGEHWFMDVWGPAETPALITQHTYAVGFIDAATKCL